MPKVSVIIPVYNSEKYLKQCLNSVINQTLKDIEIICVDDGSTDSSKDILEEYAKKDKRIIVITQKNQYAGVARNNGIKAAKGEYIHFLDSDDWLKSRKAYDYLYKQAKKKDVDVIVFQYEKVDFKTGKTIPRCKKTLMWNNQISNINEKPKFFIYNQIAPWCKFYNRKFIIENNLKFDTIITAEDRAFYIGVILNANKIMISKKTFICYRVNNKASLVGEIRFIHYDCHFKSYESINKILQKEPDNIKKMIIDITIRNFLNYYHKANGEYRDEIYEKLHKYFQTMDISICEKNSKDYWWWNEYQLIKSGDKVKAYKYFKIFKVIYYFKKNGLKATIIRIIQKFKKRFRNIKVYIF